MKLKQEYKTRTEKKKDIAKEKANRGKINI